VEKTRRNPAARVRFRAGHGRFRTWVLLSALSALAACKENLSAPPVGSFGPDIAGPLVQLNPARDTVVDSTGILLVRVDAHDPSGVRSMTFLVLPTVVAPPTVPGSDATLDALFPITLAAFKHTSFKYYVRSSDILDHETVTDTVTVTVR
jgi:hypothetical protein